jgi:hypothetical protein
MNPLHTNKELQYWLKSQEESTKEIQQLIARKKSGEIDILIFKTRIETVLEKFRKAQAQITDVIKEIISGEHSG